MVHSIHRSSLYFCPVGSAVRVAPRCSFLRPLLRPVSAITSPTQLPPASTQAPPSSLIFPPHHIATLVSHSPPLLSACHTHTRQQAPSLARTHISNAVQTDRRGPVSTRRRASSKPANSWPTAQDGHLGCLLLFVTEQKGLRSGSLGILPACLPCTLKHHRTRHLLSSFERLLQHINSSSCASLDYIYPTSSLSLNLNLSLNLSILARTSPRPAPDQSCTYHPSEAVIRGGCLPSTSPLPQCQQSPSAIVSSGLHFIPETSIPVAYQPVRSIYITPDAPLHLHVFLANPPPQV